MRAFIFDSLWNELITDKLQQRLKDAGIETIVVTEVVPITSHGQLFEGDEERLLCINPDYVGRTLSSKDYADIPNLKAILGAATSLAWVDSAVANERNIPICNIRNYSTEAVAEWAITMLLNVARQTPMLIKNGFPLDFDKDFMKYRGIELKGKKAGIIGLGNIGLAIARMLTGLGVEVVYWSRSPKENGYQHVELDQLMAESDIVFPTFSLNDETKTLMTDELLWSMKQDAILISIVYNIFNHELVLDMVGNGKLFGYGFDAKPATFDSYKGNVWAAPAYGWATRDSMENSMAMWMDNMINAEKGRFPNRIN